jgi:hypothetical protein
MLGARPSEGVGSVSMTLQKCEFHGITATKKMFYLV